MSKAIVATLESDSSGAPPTEPSFGGPDDEGWSRRSMTAPSETDSGVVGQAVAGLPDGIRVGDTVAGKYRIVRVLGSGSMGVVVAAHHLNLDRLVAIKFLVPHAFGHAESIARFLREARAAARIRSPHVVSVHDVTVLGSRIPFMELEYLEGVDLAARLRKSGPLPVGLAVDFILQACDAIGEAHDLDIIHHDLKPANLFAVRRNANVETIKVLDFGISKAAAAVASTISPADWKPAGVSTERNPIGSPRYMSPEQMQGVRDIDRRSDIWALGVTLYELVTGRVPFEAHSLVELYAIIRAQAPLHLRSRHSQIPAGLEAVLHKCLEVNRDRRFDSVGALAAALLPFGSNRAPSYVRRLTSALDQETPAATSSAIAVAPSPTDATDFADTLRSAPLALASVPPGALGSRVRRAVTWVLLSGLGIAAAAVAVVVGLLARPSARDAWTFPARARQGPAPTAASERALASPMASATATAARAPVSDEDTVTPIPELPTTRRDPAPFRAQPAPERPPSTPPVPTVSAPPTAALLQPPAPVEPAPAASEGRGAPLANSVATAWSPFSVPSNMEELLRKRK